MEESEGLTRNRGTLERNGASHRFLLSVDLTGVTDAAGNAGAGPKDSDPYDVNTLHPTVTIDLDTSALNSGQTAQVTFTFS